MKQGGEIWAVVVRCHQVLEELSQVSYMILLWWLLLCVYMFQPLLLPDSFELKFLFFNSALQRL